MQDLDVLGTESLVFFYTLLKISKQGISCFINLALTIIDLDVITKKLLGPANLFRAQTFRLYELSEVVIIGKHKEFILGAL